jgi:hypothetical protein
MLMEADVILSKTKDPRLVTIRRGGSLSDENHRRLAFWAALCAEHVLFVFEKYKTEDDRPRIAIMKTKAWANGEIRTTESKIAAYYANQSGRDAAKSAKYAAYSAGQSAVVAHVPEHGLGAAAYAIRSIMEENGKDSKVEKAREEWIWQVSKLPMEIKDLVIEDAERRNELCWNVFNTNASVLRGRPDDDAADLHLGRLVEREEDASRDGV